MARLLSGRHSRGGCQERAAKVGSQLLVVPLLPPARVGLNCGLPALVHSGASVTQPSPRPIPKAKQNKLSKAQMLKKKLLTRPTFNFKGREGGLLISIPQSPCVLSVCTGG